MSIKLKLLVLVLTLLLGSYVSAQVSINSGASNSSNETGSITSSIGQVFFNATETEEGKLTEGIQQPYEILIITGVFETRINLSLDIYPNPTSDYLILENYSYVTDRGSSDLWFKVFDNTGNIILNDILDGDKTQIDFSSFKPSFYIMQVFDNNEVVKTFKIIKN